MQAKNYRGLIGAVLVIAGGMSPMLRIPVIGNWNYWDIDTVLATLVFLFAGIGLLAAVLNKTKLLRIAGWGALVLVLFTLIAVYFKVNNYFSFIPLKKLARAAAGMIHYKWTGWILLLAGSILMLLPLGSGRAPRLTQERSPADRQL